MENTIDRKNNLLEGSVLKRLLIFFLPIAAGTLFQQFYNAVDAFVVSKYIGTDALAAVGGTPANVSNLIIGFFVALTSGCAVVISHLYGSKQYDKIKDAVKTSYIICIVIGIIIGSVVIVFTKEILTLLKTTKEAFDGSVLYQRIYFLGTIFLLIMNMASGILRSVGNSRFPFICLFIGCAVNIVLDLLFVAAFKLGIAGVAIATVISEGVSATILTIKLFKANDVYQLDFVHAKFNIPILKQMLGIGIPSGIQSSMYGISNIILQIGVNELGTITVASWAMSGKVDGIFWAITSAWGTALTAFVGQNFGAKKYDRIKESSKKSIFFLGGITVIICSVLLFVGRFILSILTKDVDVINTTMDILHYFVPFYVLWVIIEIFSGILRGVGDTIIPSTIQLVCICIFRIIWVYTIFKTYHTLFALSMSYSTSWILTDIAIIIYYVYKSKRLFNQKEKQIDESLL